MAREYADVDERVGAAGIGVGGASADDFSERLKKDAEPGGDADTNDPVFWFWQEIKDSNCYEVLVDFVEQKSTEEARTLLMAAENVDELPVTAPVNIAMRLAKRDKRCLLVDLDWERDAIAKVFDVRWDETTPQRPGSPLGPPRAH